MSPWQPRMPSYRCSGQGGQHRKLISTASHQGPLRQGVSFHIQTTFNVVCVSLSSSHSLFLSLSPLLTCARAHLPPLPSNHLQGSVRPARTCAWSPQQRSLSKSQLASSWSVLSPPASPITSWCVRWTGAFYLMTTGKMHFQVSLPSLYYCITLLF